MTIHESIHAAPSHLLAREYLHVHVLENVTQIEVTARRGDHEEGILPEGYVSTLRRT